MFRAICGKLTNNVGGGSCPGIEISFTQYVDKPFSLEYNYFSQQLLCNCTQFHVPREGDISRFLL